MSRRFSQRRLTAIFAALSDPTRRDILARLVRTGESRISEIADTCPMTLAAVSKHLRVLEEAGLIERKVEGREHWITHIPDPLDEALAWIESQRLFSED